MSAEAIVLTPAQAVALEDAYDRALVAHCTGWAHDQYGNGIGYAPAFDQDTLATLARRGMVKVEIRGGGASPLVIMTELGHEVIDDIIEEGAFGAHVAALRAHHAEKSARRAGRRAA